MGQLLRKFPALAKASTWYYALPSRDQASLKWLSVAVAIFMVYMMIWVPVQSNLNNAKTSAEQGYKDLVWMKENEARARAIAKNQNSQSKGNLSGQSLLSTISSTAQKFKIELQRFEPRGDDKVNVWLDKVSFNQMMLWVSDLEAKYGVKAEQVNIDKSDQPGEVSARLSLTI
ncbi:type II secretory pathway subunit PulM [Hahella sp. CCB-MM4]|uniref:type II secretion system protein GspM n=1 Tax=Hahella sp. (strain CCB-MM4) TaxID=1926491 RepID=UPI000B9BC0AE|nr:type II secretion system protein M [Hahella sp. CCB-MM4]OZG73367.1 type II secretory pathway subunit PulM [Hahella sp. CCB-MM4]